MNPSSAMQTLSGPLSEAPNSSFSLSLHKQARIYEKSSPCLNKQYRRTKLWDYNREPNPDSQEPRSRVSPTLPTLPSHRWTSLNLSDLFWKLPGGAQMKRLMWKVCDAPRNKSFVWFNQKKNSHNPGLHGEL